MAPMARTRSVHAARPVRRLCAVAAAACWVALLVGGCERETPAHAKARLLAAVKAGDAAAVRSVLKSFPELAKTTDDFGTPLIARAVGKSHPEIVGLLLDAGADANWKDPVGVSLLHRSIRAGDRADEVKLLLDHGVPVDEPSTLGQTPLMTAVTFGAKDVARLLVDRGAEVNARVPGFDWSVLHYAVAYGDPDTVALLLSRGADPSPEAADSSTPLYIATHDDSNPDSKYTRLGTATRPSAETAKVIEVLRKAGAK